MGELVGEEAGPGQGMSGPSDSRSSQRLFPGWKREKEKGFQGIAGRGFFKELSRTFNNCSGNIQRAGWRESEHLQER